MEEEVGHTSVMFRIIIPCLIMEISEQTKEHK